MLKKAIKFPPKDPLLQKALSRWDNEGGAGPTGPQENSSATVVNDVDIAQRRKQSLVAITTFFFLTFAWSWSFSFTATYVKPLSAIFSTVFSVVSGFGPTIAAVLTVAYFTGSSGLFAWLKNALNWRIAGQWYALAFLIPPLLMLIAQAIHWALGGILPASPAVGHLPLAIANFGLVFLIGGPLGEELGWRSYAVPALGRRVGWRTASLIIGVIWGVWHLPWFFTAGTAQSQMSFAVFMLNIIAGSVLFSWLFLRSTGSVIPVFIAHTSLNVFAGMLSIIPTAETSRPYTLVTGILIVIACWLLLRPEAQQKPGFQNRQNP